MDPADHGTRGLTPSDIPKLRLQPPDFLSTPQDSSNFAEDSDPHICATQATQLKTPVIVVEKFSTWSRLLNSTRMVFQAVRRFKANVPTRRQNESPGTSSTENFSSDDNRARNYLIKMSKNDLFSGTISSLLKRSNLDKGDKLMPFTPFLDDDGLWRVGGRLNKAPLTYSAKHPLVLYSRSRIAILLIEKARLVVAIRAWNMWRLPCNRLSWWLDWEKCFEVWWNSVSFADNGEQTMWDRRWPICLSSDFQM